MARPDDRAQDLPVGVVTFLLTDLESSTRLWRESPAAASTLARHADLIAAAVARHAGIQPVEQGEGDSTVAAFARASQALAAALDAQRGLGAEPWPDGSGAVRVRMAVHTGEAELRAPGRYGGAAIIRCARLRALARGGQVLVSAATREVVGDALPDGAALVERERVQLDGFDQRERVYQLCHHELSPPIEPLRGVRSPGLAAWPTPLVGRTRERAEVAALLARDRLVTITGAGGAGKTRLAHAVAQELADGFADGVVWVELARLSDDAQVAGTVAAACGVRETPGVPTDELLARALGDLRLLLVLDNSEHLLDGCARLVEALLRGGASVRVLATGREPLAVAGEVTWRIPPLALPPEHEHDPERLAAFDAVRLFVERARAARPEFALDGDSAPAVGRLCRRLDGIPLALELAAARVRTMTVQRLAAGLDDRFRLLTGGARTALARQRTLLASVEWSHELLDQRERSVFRRLGVFAAPFTLDAAEAVAADDDVDTLDVLDVLGRLVDKSLVQEAGGRYRLLETLRHYALDRATAAGELADVRARHLAWFVRRAAGWRLDRELATFPVLDEVAAEAPDLLAALAWSLETAGHPAVELLCALGAHWGYRHGHAELCAVMRKVLDALEKGSPAWLEALAPVAAELYFAGELDWMPAARQALEAHPDAIEPFVQGAIELGLSFGPTVAGQPDWLSMQERVAEIGRAAGNRQLELVPLLALTSTLADRGALARARPLIAWLDRHVPHDAWMRFLLDDAHALVAAFDGEFAPARRLVEPYLYDAASEKVPCFLAGMVALWTGDVTLAHRALAVAERIVYAKGAFATALQWLRGLVSLVDDDLEAAREHLDDPAPWVMVSSSARLRCWRAELALATGDVEHAAALLDEVEPRLAGLTMHAYVAVVHLLRAEVARRRGEIREGETRAHAALELAAEHEIALLVTDALETLALLAGDVGNDAQAARLLGAAEGFRRRTGYRWRPHHRRAALDTLRPRLDPGHLEEGATLSLDDAVAWARRGRGERRRPEFGWDSLTPSEERVVELVAAGLPNREIAAKLFVSVATVKTHLIHVYGKLGVRTRAELAAAATSRGLELRDRSSKPDYLMKGETT